MKFHEWVTLASFARQLEEDLAVVYAGIYRDALATGNPISRACVTVEPQWVKARRPYYLVYPAIFPALIRLKLDLDCGLIHLPLPSLVFRLPEKNPLSFEHDGRHYRPGHCAEGMSQPRSCRNPAGWPHGPG